MKRKHIIDNFTTIVRQNNSDVGGRGREFDTNLSVAIMFSVFWVNMWYSQGKVFYWHTLKLYICMTCDALYWEYEDFGTLPHRSKIRLFLRHIFRRFRMGNSVMQIWSRKYLHKVYVIWRLSKNSSACHTSWQCGHKLEKMQINSFQLSFFSKTVCKGLIVRWSTSGVIQVRIPKKSR